MGRVKHREPGAPNMKERKETLDMFDTLPEPPKALVDSTNVDTLLKLSMQVNDLSIKLCAMLEYATQQNKIIDQLSNNLNTFATYANGVIAALQQRAENLEKLPIRVDQLEKSDMYHKQRLDEARDKLEAHVRELDEERRRKAVMSPQMQQGMREQPTTSGLREQPAAAGIGVTSAHMQRHPSPLSTPQQQLQQPEHISPQPNNNQGAQNVPGTTIPSITERRT